MIRYGKFALALALLVVVGCSKPPEMEMKAANDALAAAKSAEAEQYAPKAYRTANDTLGAASAAKAEQDAKFALFRSYSGSKNLFVRAEALAKEAATAAATEKARVKAEVEGMLTQAKSDLDSASAALAKAPVGKGNKADIELIKNDLASTMTAYDDAQMDYNNGKYLTARSKVNAVMQRTASIMQQIEQAKAMAKGGKR
ncbi:MAG: hypothetical protein FJY67_02660 [Calditrichaeota bacterium]|nr:hypothetical protein [Calditrichota bacterium]